MIKAVRKYGILERGWIIAAILAAAAFTSTRVACLAHTHCVESACFDEHGDSDEHGDHHDNHGDDCGTDSQCDHEHHNHDIHHHTHSGHVHPQRRFTAPVFEVRLTETAGEETPDADPAETVPDKKDPPPLDRYGLTFAERAPPVI